jgi:hypothetical protein
MDLIVVLFEVGLFPLEGPRLKTGPISKPLAFVSHRTATISFSKAWSVGCYPTVVVYPATLT